ncbi:hypothetical protein Hanom_Chr05g00393491 [Helianthus anomalus]
MKNVDLNIVTNSVMKSLVISFSSHPDISAIGWGVTCPKGFLVFYTRILDQPNLWDPFANIFLEVLKYYRLSLGHLAHVGVAHIMHFEILCRALSYEPSLLMFHRFFSLAWNGDWYTIEKTQCEAPLLSTTVGHTYA